MNPAVQPQADPQLGLIRDRIKGYACFKYGVQDAEAEDLAQDVVIVLLDRYREKSDPAELMRIALGILFRLFIDRWRKKRRRGDLYPVDIADLLLPDGQDDPETKLIKIQIARLLDKEIEDLGEPCRAILRMQYYNQASTEEIMRAVGARTPNAVYLRASRCREELGEKIKKTGVPW